MKLKAPMVTIRPRERRLALMAGIVIGCWVMISWLVQPLWERARDLQLRVKTQTEKLEALGRLAAQASSVGRNQQVLAAYLQTEDEEQARGVFLNELEALSTQANLQLNLKPKPVKRVGRLSHFEVELDVEGLQPSLLAFLDALLGMPRLLTIERLRIAGLPSKPDTLRANLVIHRLIVPR